MTSSFRSKAVISQVGQVLHESLNIHILYTYECLKVLFAHERPTVDPKVAVSQMLFLIYINSHSPCLSSWTQFGLIMLDSEELTKYLCTLSMVACVRNQPRSNYLQQTYQSVLGTNLGPIKGHIFGAEKCIVQI